MSVLIECRCHVKQSLKNKKCNQCETDLDKIKRSSDVSYWITYRLNKKLHFEKVNPKYKPEGMGLFEYAKICDEKRKIQKAEGDPILQIRKERRTTFQQLTDWYLEQKSVEALASYPQIQIYLNRFNKEFGSIPIADIKPSMLENFKVKLKDEGKAEATIDYIIGAGKTVVNKAFDDGEVTGETVRAFKKVKKYLMGERRNANQRRRILSPEEFYKIFNNAPPILRPIFLMGYDTGMREGEIKKLSWGMISLRDKLITLPKEITKDREERVIPITENLHKALIQLPRGINDDIRVFTSRGRPIKSIEVRVEVACKRAGIVYGRFTKDGFIFHDLRRTFYSDMRRARVADSVIRTITGHSRREVTDRYDIVNLADLREAIAKLTEYRQTSYQDVYQIAVTH